MNWGIKTMKNILLFAFAMVFSIFAHADLQRINEASVFIADNKLALNSELSSPDTIKNIGKVGDIHNNHLNNTQNLALNSNLKGTAQDVSSVLPKMMSNGLKIQIPSQTVSYGTINMGMGEISSGAAFTKLPEFKK